MRGKCGDRKEQPRTSPVKYSECKNKRRSRPFLEGPKSRTMSSAESRWLCEEQVRELEEDLEEERGSPSSSRLSVLSSLSICSSIDSSSDSSPAESRLPRCMLTSRLRRRTLLIKVSVRCASVHNCVCDDRPAASSTLRSIPETLTHKSIAYGTLLLFTFTSSRLRSTFSLWSWFV